MIDGVLDTMGCIMKKRIFLDTGYWVTLWVGI